MGKLEEIEDDLNAFCSFNRGDERIKWLIDEVKRLRKAVEKHKESLKSYQYHPEDRELYKVFEEK